MAGKPGVVALIEKAKLLRPVATVRNGPRGWYTIKTAAAADDTPASAEISIYGDIGYYDVTASDFVAELKEIDASDIAVRINSRGGEVWDGLAIYNALKDHPANITTHVDGIAASAASIILQAGDNRRAAKASQVMIHDGWGIVVGGAEDMRAMADLLDQTNDMLAEIYKDRAGGALSVWRAAMRAESWYTGSEAKAAGLVDDVEGQTEEEDTEDDSPAASFDLTVFSHAGRRAAPAPVIPPPAFNWDGAAFMKAVEEAMS